MNIETPLITKAEKYKRKRLKRCYTTSSISRMNWVVGEINIKIYQAHSIGKVIQAMTLNTLRSIGMY